MSDEMPENFPGKLTVNVIVALEVNARQISPETLEDRVRRVLELLGKDAVVVSAEVDHDSITPVDDLSEAGT